jgi:diguanylate cyclase
MLRKTDIAARYGGEEFILLLPETSAKTAGTVAEKLRKQIEDTVVKTEKHSVKLTAGFGVSDYPGKTEPKSQDRILFEIVTNADNALYASKNSDRNRVTIHQI